ncbi:uncharacterized protein Z520_02127 [Fonsecaea multimorphosa CBS 102226]|uniref:Uncharacterized protein n=1 Tax=Fonsecaea multimorphosa CBS 102226 TaxID=1442371 RepID=A0A0D2KYV2_9EURO|nr:uncharacterized protein Z520_02127 [Fonsecaea multimorphosa CBS 102226]KIY01989.1 hypothetical protein Z520_02127 [Fonsecaea multimorphosa CBS 102226]OAL29670.1 hypothetical protein AYO22_02084 [Fonsecaea multimorphosa]
MEPDGLEPGTIPVLEELLAGSDIPELVLEGFGLAIELIVEEVAVELAAIVLRLEVLLGEVVIPDVLFDTVALVMEAVLDRLIVVDPAVETLRLELLDELIWLERMGWLSLWSTQGLNQRRSWK